MQSNRLAKETSVVGRLSTCSAGLQQIFPHGREQQRTTEVSRKRAGLGENHAQLILPSYTNQTSLCTGIE